jgi:hypothetical protein
MKTATRKLLRNFKRWNRATSAPRDQIAEALRNERFAVGSRNVRDSFLVLSAADCR